MVSKKRRKDQPSNPEAEPNIAPVAQAVQHEGNVLDNRQECHGVFLPAQSTIKRTSRKKLESHQTKLSDFGTRRIDLRLRSEEVDWLLTECALRPCYTWGDGYCGYRSVAAIRNTTMKTLLADVTSVLERREGKVYQHQGTESSEVITIIRSERDHAKWITQLQYVTMALNQCLYTINSTYYCQDDILEIVAAIDNMYIIFVNTSSLCDNQRYRVFTPTVMQTCRTLQEVAEVIRPFRNLGKSIRGVGFGNTHYCAFYPANEEPNFAGTNCIGQWD